MDSIIRLDRTNSVIQTGRNGPRPDLNYKLILTVSQGHMTFTEINSVRLGQLN